MSACESTLSATNTARRLDLPAGELEEPLVVLLLGVEEDDVEDVVDRGQRLERVALDQLGPVVEAGLGDVAAPGLALGAGRARARARGRRGGERRPRARSSSSRASRRSRAPRSPSAARRARRGTARSCARPGGRAARARRLPRARGVLLLEPREHGADAVVEHQRRSRSTASRTRQSARWSFTIPHACIVE